MRTSAAAARTPAVTRPAKKAKPRGNPRAEAKLFGKAMLVIVVIVAALLAVLIQRIAIMHTLIESDAIKDQIDKEVLIRDNLEAKAASLAASPGIQRRATKSIGMVPAQDVDFITAEKRISSRMLAADMRYFDRSSGKVKNYRAQLSRKATAVKTKTPAESQSDVQGASLPAQPESSLQANRSAGPTSAGQ